MGQVYTYNYIYHVEWHNINTDHGISGQVSKTQRTINGYYSQWNSSWSPMACISGDLTSDSDVFRTLAYTTGVNGSISNNELSYTNGGLNGSGFAGNKRYTITLNSSQRQEVNNWLKNSTSGFHTTIVTSSLLPSYANNQNMLVFNLSGTKSSKIYIGLRGYYKNAKYTAQQSYNGCLQYGMKDLPTRYFHINATYCPYAKPNGRSYLYDYNTNLYPVTYKYTSSLTTDYQNNMRNITNASSIPWNYENSNVSSSFPYISTTTYRVIQYDASSGSAIIENAVSPYYVTGIRATTVENNDPGMQTPITICCNEVYYNTKILNLITDEGIIAKHSFSYSFDPNIIPVTGNSGITNNNGNVYGYGHVFYSVNYPFCLWLSDTTSSQTMIFHRVGNQVTISFGTYQTTMTYQPVITVAVLSNDPSGVCYYTVSNLTPGFDKRIEIYPFNPTEPLVNTSAVHTALTQSLKTHTDERWVINTSSAQISGVFSTNVSNETLCITLMDINVTYLTYTYDSVNITIDVVPLNQQTGQYVVKTGISTSEFVDNISTTVTIPWQNNGVNLLLPCSAQTYYNGTYIGIEALSVNQNTFGLALQYLEKDIVPPQDIAPLFNPYLEHFFGRNDIIIESENDNEDSSIR